MDSAIIFFLFSAIYMSQVTDKKISAGFGVLFCIFGLITFFIT